MRMFWLPAGSLAGALVATTLVLATASASPEHVQGGTIWVTERTPGGQSTVAAIDSATMAIRIARSQAMNR